MWRRAFRAAQAAGRTARGGQARLRLGARGTAAVATVGGCVGLATCGTLLLAKEGEGTHPNHLPGLPYYTSEEVAAHKTRDQGIWVSYNGGVYDVTEFSLRHPGGAKILLASGGRLEPFWRMYQVHTEKSVLDILAGLRIGNHVETQKVAKEEDDDPYKDDPERNPALVVNKAKPFNAETPGELLADKHHTPNDFFFVRNHLPVPKEEDLNPETFRLTVDGVGVPKARSFSVQELKDTFGEKTITATISCAGNRRKGMMGVERPDNDKIHGLGWELGAIGNAKWTGVLLSDVLEGVDFKNEGTVQHVQVDGKDIMEDGKPYGASIPIKRATDPSAEVLIAWEMNGEPIPRDHGAPLRAIIPGVTGARNVKWLSKIYTSPEESRCFFQVGDYKTFTPGQSTKSPPYKDAAPIYDMPVTSAICQPAEGTKVEADDEKVEVRGYAWSGSGNDINRVDLTADGGRTWVPATMEDEEGKPAILNNPQPRHWSWRLWSADIPLTAAKEGKLEVCSRATDSAQNTQPAAPHHIWNQRGLCNNSWHCVNLSVVEALEGGDSE